MAPSLIKRVLLTLLVLAFTCEPLLAQQPPEDRTTETSANVPALNEFHHVVLRIWHTAWPAKDYDMLADLLPEIGKGVAAVANAELPGILRDKKVVWRIGVERLDRGLIRCVPPGARFRVTSIMSQRSLFIHALGNI